MYRANTFFRVSHSQSASPAGNVLGSREKCAWLRENRAWLVRETCLAREKRACARERKCLLLRERNVPVLARFVGASLWPHVTAHGAALVRATGFLVFLAQNKGGPASLLVRVSGRKEPSREVFWSLQPDSLCSWPRTTGGQSICWWESLVAKEPRRGVVFLRSQRVVVRHPGVLFPRQCRAIRFLRLSRFSSRPESPFLGRCQGSGEPVLPRP